MHGRNPIKINFIQANRRKENGEHRKRNGETSATIIIAAATSANGHFCGNKQISICRTEKYPKNKKTRLFEYAPPIASDFWGTLHSAGLFLCRGRIRPARRTAVCGGKGGRWELSAGGQKRATPLSLLPARFFSLKVPNRRFPDFYEAFPSYEKKRPPGPPPKENFHPRSPTDFYSPADFSSFGLSFRQPPRLPIFPGSRPGFLFSPPRRSPPPEPPPRPSFKKSSPPLHPATVCPFFPAR